jgi:hypothetical protein
MKEAQEYVDGYELHALGWLFWLNFLALQGEGGREIADHRADILEKNLKRVHVSIRYKTWLHRAVYDLPVMLSPR